MRRLFSILLCLLFTASLCACGTQENSDDTRLQVIATSFPPYDFARAVAGDLAAVTMLIDPGTEMHSYDPTPGDIRRIQSADVFLCGGGVSDAWVEDLLSSIGREDLPVLRMTEVVTLLEAEHAEEDDKAHLHEAEYDEHVWTSPVNAAAIVSATADILAAADPENEAAYRENAQRYADEILALSEDIRKTVENGERDILLFADRFPFLYFAREYGLSYDSAFPGCAEESEPGAQTIARLQRRLTEEKIPVVFYTEFSNMQLADALCEASGATKLLFHSCHNVSRSDFEAGVTYLSLMKQNHENLRKALSAWH